MGYDFRLALRAETTDDLAEREAADSIREWAFDGAEPSRLELVVPEQVRDTFARGARRRLERIMREEGAHPDSRVTVITREQYRALEEARRAARG